MKFQLQLMTNWKFFLPMGVALISLLWSIFNFVTGKLIASKITNNDLKHLKEKVEDLKDENKEIKIDLKADLGRIFRRLGKIEKIQYAQQKVCNERHSKDRK